MIRPLVAVLVVSVGVCLAQPRRGKQPPPSGPIVVELFTSEGCSSCPPADQVLANLERQGVIVLGEHVDYWDELGWKDRFASPLFTSRQQDYGEAMRNGHIFTPQVIVNGEREMLGTDTSSILRTISEFNRKPRAEVILKSGEKDTIEIQVGKLPQGSHKADVLLAVAESGLETRVDGGENSGRVLRHAAVVRSLSRLAQLDPAKPGDYHAQAKLNLRPEWVKSNLKLVLLVQDRENRHILGAAAMKP